MVMDYETFLKQTEGIQTIEGTNYFTTSNIQDFNIKSAYYICKEISEKQKKNKDGYVVIGLSGGKTPIDVYKQISIIKGELIDASKLIFFMIDERYKPDDHKFSNYNNINFIFKDLQIDEATQVYRPDTTKPIVECVLDYNKKIKSMLEKYKQIDLVILGMGSDFHIASLFPNVFTNIYMNNYQNNYIYKDQGEFQMAGDDYENLRLLKECVYFTTTNQFDVRKRITVSLRILERASSKLFLLNSAEKIDLWKTMLIKSYVYSSYTNYPATCIMDSGNTTVITHGYDNFTRQLKEIYGSKTIELADGAFNMNKKELLTIIVFGCSGDLAQKKIYPALFKLFCNNILPKDVLIIGFARTSQPFQAFFDKISIYLKKALQCYKDFSFCKQKHVLNAFKNRCRYYIGNYCSSEDFEKFNKYLLEEEQSAALCVSKNNNDNQWLEDYSCNEICDGCDLNEKSSKLEDESFTAKDNQTSCVLRINRILHLALPPHIFVPTLKNYKEQCQNKNGYERILLEKPFGTDLDSFKVLSKQILEYCNEESLYRIDHYLGKDMVLGLLKMKFTNTFLLSLMNRHFIKCIRVTLKETKGILGRGQYFDPYGIIRDVMQNHMLQLLTLITMEYPENLDDDSVKNEKVKILKSIPAIRLENTIIGQYVKAENYDDSKHNDETDDPSKKNHGYHDDPYIKPDSITPTFCTCILYINSINWHGVPIIFKAGKGLNEDVCEIRIQFHNIMGSSDHNMYNNEFVIILQPVEGIYLKMMTKKPGFDDMEEVQLNLTPSAKVKNTLIPEAYETLLCQCMEGYKRKFISHAELYESWRIFTPLLNELQEKSVKPLKYEFGTSGPSEGYHMVKKYYNYGDNYKTTPVYGRKSSLYADDLLDVA